jgi:hypothetical protein
MRTSHTSYRSNTTTAPTITSMNSNAQMLPMSSTYATVGNESMPRTAMVTFQNT